MEQTPNAGELAAQHSVTQPAKQDSFFHRMSERPPYQSAFPMSEAPNVTPAAFGAEWEERVEEWGKVMKQSSARCWQIA